VTLRVLTLNVWNRDGDWPARRAALRHCIAALEPDLIGFQELLRGPDFDQLGELLGDSSYHLAFAPASPFWMEPSLEFGNGVASRWPITDKHPLTLPDGGDYERRIVLAVRVASPWGPLCFATTHLNYQLQHGHVRMKQVVALAEHASALGAPLGFPVIVTGDFNAEPDSDEIRYMGGLHAHAGSSVHFRDAFRVARQHDGASDAGPTWSHRNPYTENWYEPDRRIDYVFVGSPGPGGLGHVQSCRVVCDQPVDGVWPTDHFGVLAELSTP
jgi:endonuclease/exonuclease/phosphatase family metal-dependent hydrolase